MTFQIKNLKSDYIFREHLTSVSLLPLDQDASVVVEEVISDLVMFPDLALSRYWIIPTLHFRIFE